MPGLARRVGLFIACVGACVGVQTAGIHLIQPQHTLASDAGLAVVADGLFVAPCLCAQAGYQHLAARH